jgi:prenyl protein peptidase
MLILVCHTDLSFTSGLHLMGLYPVGMQESWNTLRLTATLFAAPLYEALLVEGGLRRWFKPRFMRDLWTDMRTWRNIVAVCCPLLT